MAEHEVATRWVTFRNGGDEIRGYLAEPRSDRPHGAIVTAPENLGVTEHRQAETRRLAAEGFVVLSVDPYSRIGGRPPQDYRTPEERRIKAFLAAKDETAVPDMQAGFEYLATLSSVDPARIGALGYCMGGGTALAWAATPTSKLTCAVVLYAIPVLPPEYRPDGKPLSRIELARHIRCPMQLHFGSADEAIPLEQALTLKGSLERESPHSVEFHVYEGARHAYMDSTLERYSPEAAALTYRRMVEFFHRHLSEGSEQ